MIHRLLEKKCGLRTTERELRQCEQGEGDGGTTLLALLLQIESWLVASNNSEMGSSYHNRFCGTEQ
jgi:hypothetical protein